LSHSDDVSEDADADDDNAPWVVSSVEIDDVNAAAIPTPSGTIARGATRATL
jgi:hypothetical protein